MTINTVFCDMASQSKGAEQDLSKKKALINFTSLTTVDFKCAYII